MSVQPLAIALNLASHDRDQSGQALPCGDCGRNAMTSHELNTEIEILRLQQVDQQKHWRRWGFASNVVAIALCIAVLIRTAVTGGTPPPLMIFIVLTYVFLGLAFTTAGRSRWDILWLPHRSHRRER
jgi:hypothetical protein